MRRTYLAGGLLLASLSAVVQSAETIAYRYDTRGRLVRVERTGTVNDGVTTSYQFDKADNRLARTIAGAANPFAIIPSGSGYRLVPLQNPSAL